MCTREGKVHVRLFVREWEGASACEKKKDSSLVFVLSSASIISSTVQLLFTKYTTYHYLTLNRSNKLLTLTIFTTTLVVRIFCERVLTCYQHSM